jgi:hypothetical protein
MPETLLETVQMIQHRAERLEQEAAELRQELSRMAEVLADPYSVVARYIIEGKLYEITQADVNAVKGGLAKSWDTAALYDLAVIKKMTKTLRENPPEAQSQYLLEKLDAIRAASIVDGTAIDSEDEAAIDD